MPKAPDPKAVARAERLRKEIEKLKQGRSDKTESEESGSPMSPREFVEKRMRELDKNKRR